MASSTLHLVDAGRSAPGTSRAGEAGARNAPAAPPDRPAAVDDASPAWSLFADREALERRLTDEVRANVRARHGVDIPAEAPAAGETPAA
jgi:hypothetical protein